MTIKEYIGTYHRTITIAILGLMVLFFMIRSCAAGKQTEKFKQLQAEAKVLRDKVTADSVTRANQRIAENAQLAVQRQETAAAIADKKAADKKVTQVQATVLQLASEVQRLKKTPADSSFVKVHPDYVANCDTLAARIPVLNQQINDYRQQADEAVDLLNYEVLLRDSIIEKEKAYSEELRGDFNRQANALKIALRDGMPRGKFLVGAGVIGNQTTFLSGAKVSFAYQTKGGKQYQGGAILMSGTVWYEAGVMIQLFK